MPSQPLFTEFWSDLLSVASVLIGLIGFCYTILQLWKTKIAADAARDAADKAVTESQKLFQRYALENAFRFLAETKIHVDHSSWDKASMRLSDVAEQVAQLAQIDPDWEQLTSELREWEATLRRMAGTSRSRFATTKWRDFMARLHRKVDETRGPFKGFA